MTSEQPAASAAANHDRPDHPATHAPDKGRRFEMLLDLTSDQPLCRHCDSPLIGSEIGHTTCGDCGGRAVGIPSSPLTSER